MPTDTTIRTEVPAGVGAERVLALLHDHDHYIRTTCPQLIGYERQSEAGAAPAVYEVTDKRPIGQTTFRLTLTDRADGIDALIEGKAPTGSLRVDSRFRLVGAADAPGGLVLEEKVSIDSNVVMNKMIKGNVEKKHPEQNRGFLTAATA